MSERPVWEETWRPSDFEGYDDDWCNVERARIASCAPEAVRYLIEMEWHQGHCILGCGGDEEAGHAIYCRWAELMKKAGVR